MRDMNGKVSSSGEGNVHHYNRTDSSQSGKKFPDDPSVGGSKSSEDSGGYTYPFVKKMFPGITPAEAKKFVDNLFNQLNQQIKRAIEHSKKNREEWQGQDD